MRWWHEFWASRRLKRYHAKALHIAITRHSLGLMDHYYAINRDFAEWEHGERAKVPAERYRAPSRELTLHGVT